MMIEYIDREKLLEIIAISKCDSRKTTCDKCDEKAFCIYGVVENFPAEDVAPVVNAKWINDYCSNCGADIPTDSARDYIADCDCKYCYYCGAKIDL